MTANANRSLLAQLGHVTVHRVWSVNEGLWRRLPNRLRESRPMRFYGSRMHLIVCRRSTREMYLGTMFLRNRPALELMRRLADTRPPGSTFRIVVLGCSIGVEVYSIIWTIRSTRPDLDLVVRAVDVSAEALEMGERGIYGPEAVDMVQWPIFERMTDAERRDIFDWDGDRASVKPQLRTGVSWHLADACDAGLVGLLARHDLVVASNFLCHMDAEDAEVCLRNLASLVTSGGHLVTLGVDLDVRSNVARDLGWKPVEELRDEIHDGDPAVRADWPWHWWGLEPLDRRRPDWQLRYASVFRIGEPAS